MSRLNGGMMRATTALLGLLVILCATQALADESIEDFLERYEMALDHGDMDLLSEVYEDWSQSKASQLQRYFRTVVAEFNVEFQEVEVNRVQPDEARVRFLRRDHFTDASTGQRVRKQIRLKKVLQLREGRWRVAGRY